MKYPAIIFTYLLLSCLNINAQTVSSMLLNKDFVDLKGKAATTVFINSTPDTLKLGYVFFNWLPYSETRDTLKIYPGQRDSIILTYNFPQFLQINNRFEVYNCPGCKMVCTIRDYRSENIDMSFAGPLAQENIYYLAYQQFLGNYDQESRPYYAISDHLNDWNQFPAKADSITQIRSLFLDRYKGELPEWFKKHEHRRLLYNQYLRLSNALNAKEFYSGRKINVDAGYYNFEKLLNKEDDMILSDIGDVNLMFLLGRFYKSNKPGYDVLITTLKFKQPERKKWLDSAVKIILSMPHLGKKAPDIALTNLSGQHVSLTDFTGKMVIINFWGVWCGPCKAAFPYENQLYKKYKDKGLVMIDVCFDSDRENWIKDSKKYNLQMVNLFTNKNDYNKLIKQYNLTGIPRSILINREGNVVDNYLKVPSLFTDKDMVKILETK
jgi:thiol-disulfide isomerase/thioredoxin